MFNNVIQYFVTEKPKKCVLRRNGWWRGLPKKFPNK